MTSKSNATSVVTIEPKAQPMSQSVHPGTMIQALIANHKEIDIAKLEGLFELQMKYDNEIARKAYHAAKSQFAALAPTIITDGQAKFEGRNSGNTTEYKFATLAGTMDQIRDALKKCGLHVGWKTDDVTVPGALRVTCFLTHDLGYQEDTSLSADKQAGKGTTGMNTLQAVKSTTSYLERITLYALLGLASKDDDDDGKGAVVEIAKISAQQLKALTTKVAKVGIESAKILELFEVETLADLGADQLKQVHAMLNLKAAADKKEDAK